MLPSNPEIGKDEIKLDEVKAPQTIPDASKYRQDTILTKMSDEIWRYFIDGFRQAKDDRFDSIIKLMNEILDTLPAEQKSITTKDLIEWNKIWIEKKRNNSSITVDQILPEEIKGEELREKLGKLVTKYTYFAYTQMGLDKDIDIPLERFVNQAKAYMPFEFREPGYTLAVIKSFVASLKPDRKLDVESILKVHSEVTSGVRNTGYDDVYHEYKKGQFRSGSIEYYGLSENNSSQHGIEHILKKMWYGGYPYAQIQIGGFSKKSKSNVNSKTLKEEAIKAKINISDEKEVQDFLAKKAEIIYKQNIDPNRSEEFEGKSARFESVIEGNKEKSVSDVIKIELSNYISTLEKNLKEAKNSDDKLNAIINFVQDCEQLHPFNDANCRTFCMVILNPLLIQNGFLPTIQLNPNRFDARHPDEIRVDLIQGMQYTAQLISRGSTEELELFGIKTSEVTPTLTETQKRYHESMVSAVTNYVKELAISKSATQLPDSGLFGKGESSKKAPQKAATVTRRPSLGSTTDQ